MSNKVKAIIWTIIEFIVVVLSVVALGLSSHYKQQEIRETHQETIDIYQEQLKEKDNKIIELEKIQEELKTQIEKLEKENKKLKTTTTSRSGSSSNKTSVTASSTPGWIWANVSAYCACMKCCGKTNGITASGAKAKANHTIAAPSTYKFGTKIEIAGMGVYTVEDRGGAITGNKLDIYFNSHSEALKFGRKQLQIRVVK